MPNVYNPSSPTAMGLEWFPNLGPLTQDLSAVGSWAQRIRSRSAETINKFKLAFQTANDSHADCMLCEVIPSGSEVPTGAVVVGTYAPDADVAVGTWLNQAGSGVNVFQSIDEGVDTFSGADYAHSTVGSTSNYDIRFATAAFPATARVLNVTVRLVLACSGPNNSGIINPYLLHRTSSTVYALASSFVQGYGQAGTVKTFDLGEINPKTQLPWTPADIIGFDGGTNVWALRIQSAASATFQAWIYAAEIRVTYQTVENRVAAATWIKGSVQLSGGVDSSAFVGLPAAGASWAKPVSGDFTLLFRQPSCPLIRGISGSGSRFLVWYTGRSLSGVEQAHAVPGVVSAIPTLDSYGQVTAVDFTQSTKGRCVAVDVKTSAPADSADSLPYTQGTITITATQLARQQITPAASASYPIIRFDVRPGAATNPLLIKIKRNADNVQFGSTYTLQPSEVLASPIAAGFYEVQIVLTTPPALISGTKYYVELTTADTSTAGWQMPGVSSATVGGDGAGFNGTTDQGDYNGSGFIAASDIPITIAQTPAAPSNQNAAIVLTQPANWVVAQSGCNIPSVQLAQFTWTKTSLGSTLFLRYEIQRTEDNGVTWTTVAYISAEATQSWTDQETPRGTNLQYRIRVVRSLDGATSAWTAASKGVTAQAVGCEVIFSSNERPLLMVAYNRDADMQFGFLAAARDQFMQIFGSNYSVAFMETEDPGVSFQMTLTVNFKDAPVRDDIGIYGPLRAIARAATSYVCVLDWTGNRWYAHLQITEGQWSEPGYEYHATVVVTEVSGTPSIAVA